MSREECKLFYRHTLIVWVSKGQIIEIVLHRPDYGQEWSSFVGNYPKI